MPDGPAHFLLKSPSDAQAHRGCDAAGESRTVDIAGVAHRTEVKIALISVEDIDHACRKIGGYAVIKFHCISKFDACIKEATGYFGYIHRSA